MTFASMVVVIVTIAVLIGIQLYIPRKALLPVMGLIIALDLTGANVPVAAPFCIALIVATFFVAWFRAQPSIRVWRADSRNPLVLDAPFKGL